MEKKRDICQFNGLLELYFTDILNSDYSIKFAFNYFFFFFFPLNVSLQESSNTLETIQV